LNLKCDILVSKFAFKFNLYRYVTEAWTDINLTAGGCVQVECSCELFHSLKAPGLVSTLGTYNMKTWFQNLHLQMQLVPLYITAPAFALLGDAFTSPAFSNATRALIAAQVVNETSLCAEMLPTLQFSVLGLGISKVGGCTS
jgi:hypothetical protein